MPFGSNEKKKKTSIMQILFGGNGGSSNTDYQIIYFGISIAATKNGNEQFANIVYGNESGVFTSMLPLSSVMFTYKNEVVLPTIKINKGVGVGLIGGSGSHAEIYLPVGYSFMSAPLAVQMEVVKESVEDKIDELPIAAEASKTPRPMHDPYSFVKNNNRDIQGSEVDDDESKNVDNKEEKPEKEMGSLETESKVIKSQKPPRAVKDKNELIHDDSEFVLGFDEDSMQNKINQFLSRHGTNEDKKTVDIPHKKQDDKSIQEIKKETSDAEVDRVLQNAQQIAKDAGLTDKMS